MASGYVACACRDCFDIAIADESDEHPAMCLECEQAGCDHDGESECEREDAYDSEPEDAEEVEARMRRTVWPGLHVVQRRKEDE